MDLRQVKAIEQANKNKLLKAFPTLNEESGIYVISRRENDFKFAYIGQAKHILTRLAQHLIGYEHIDLSLKKRGLLSGNNLLGWDIQFTNFPESQLNEKEQDLIKAFANGGYQLYNKTIGGQSTGKNDLGDKEVKGYRCGVDRGYFKAQKYITELFSKNLRVEINGETNKRKEKALEKFNQFLIKEN